MKHLLQGNATFSFKVSVHAQMLFRYFFNMEQLLLRSVLPWMARLFQTGTDLNPTALRKVKIECNFGLRECNRVKGKNSPRGSLSFPLRVKRLK